MFDFNTLITWDDMITNTSAYYLDSDDEEDSKLKHRVKTFVKSAYSTLHQNETDSSTLNNTDVFLALVDFYFYYAKMKGINPVLAILQTAIDTDYLQSTNSFDYKNTANIKVEKSITDTTGTSAAWTLKKYKRYVDSIRAQIDHMYQFAQLCCTDDSLTHLTFDSEHSDRVNYSSGIIQMASIGGYLLGYEEEDEGTGNEGNSKKIVDILNLILNNTRIEGTEYDALTNVYFNSNNEDVYNASSSINYNDATNGTLLTTEAEVSAAITNDGNSLFYRTKIYEITKLVNSLCNRKVTLVQRLVIPETDNKYYIRNADDSTGYSYAIPGSPQAYTNSVLANCVGYAYGRFNEIYGHNACLCLRAVNAGAMMGYANIYIDPQSDTIDRELGTGTAPQLGACMVWQRIANNSNGQVGHVAIVEAIYGDKVLTSESSYEGKAFYNELRSNNSGNWDKTGYTFVGFIYNPAVSEQNNQA